MKLEEPENFTELPREATELELEGLGARYLTTRQFEHQTTGKLIRIEYMVLEQDGKYFGWKRFEGEELFKIHMKASIDRQSEDVSYTANSKL